MSVTILGEFGTEFPVETAGAIVRTKQLWKETDPTKEEWTLEPELRATRANASVAFAGIGSLELVREYGPGVKSPHEKTMAVRKPIDRLGYWVRVDLMGVGGLQPAWFGRITSERRNVMSGSPDPVTKQPKPIGVQTFVAREPAHDLTKISVSRSLWVQNMPGATTTEELNIAWIPPMNRLDERGLVVGNRTGGRFVDGFGDTTGTHFYGGDALWSRKDYIEYLLRHFIDQSAQDGPSWVLAGQADLLDTIHDSIRWSATQTLEQMISRLIPPSLGVGWRVEAIPTSPSPGFQVTVFALQPTERSFGGATLPRNPQHVVIQPNLFRDVVSVNVVQSSERQFDRIRVIGARVVSCFTLDASDIFGQIPSLVPKWSDAIEVNYKKGADVLANPTSKDHDLARSDDRFHEVYTRFGAPADWDRNAGDAVPVIGFDGVLIGRGADQQNRVRETLPWLPLLAGFDYAGGATVDNNAPGVVAEQLPPQAWLLDNEWRWVGVDEAGFNVAASRADWGLLIKGSPRHRLAKHHWSADDAKTSDAVPDFDWVTLKATIAFRTDQRLTLEFRLTSAGQTIGDVIDVHVPDAEFWYMAPATVVGVNPDGGARTSGGSISGTGRVLRNDMPVMLLRMAGAIARYNMLRARAEIVLKGSWPWPFLLGQILTVIEQGTGTQFINAPITEVAWSFEGDPTTTIRTGFAR